MLATIAVEMVLMVAQTLARDLAVLTHNTREFARVDELRVLKLQEITRGV